MPFTQAFVRPSFAIFLDLYSLLSHSVQTGGGCRQARPQHALPYTMLGRQPAPCARSLELHPFSHQRCSPFNRTQSTVHRRLLEGQARPLRNRLSRREPLVRGARGPGRRSEACMRLRSEDAWAGCGWNSPRRFLAGTVESRVTRASTRAPGAQGPSTVICLSDVS